MSRITWPKDKTVMLLGIIGVYLLLAGALYISVQAGLIPRSPPAPKSPEGNDNLPDIPPSALSANLQWAETFVDTRLATSNGHIMLYITPYQNNSLDDRSTNSEAISYYLLWTAQANDKKSFDRELDYLQAYMIQPKLGYMMWHLDKEDHASGDGSNIATDADLRAIKALLIAEKQWKDERYTLLISQLAAGIEKVGITDDGYLAPYGGMSGDTATWTAKEVWLSYSDFVVFRELANRRGAVWSGIYDKMKAANLKAQIANGLYNSMLTQDRKYGNSLDAGGYSINSAWIMVRNAESGDNALMRSANRSLMFYKNKFQIDGELYANYGSNGDALSPSDTPWIYALVGRAAVALDDKEFSATMMQKLADHQITDTNSSNLGAFPEGMGNQTRIGQFTMQESILSMQDYVAKSQGGWVYGSN